MKNIIYIVTISLFFLSSCDKIEGPYIQESSGITVSDTFPPLDRSSVYRKILIEEYTGHLCVNCPKGHVKVAELSSLFGDTLAVIGIHATQLARPTGNFYVYDFRVIPEGENLCNDFAISSIPAAVVNRTKFGGNNWALNIDQWQNAIQSVERTVYAGIQILSEEKEGVLKVYTKTTMLETYNSPLLLSMFLVEDNIIKPQLNDSRNDTTYQHNHVFRASFNKTYGDPLTPDGILVKDSAYLKGYNLDFKEKDWKIRNCSIVVFLHDPATKEVLQVEVMKQ